MSPEHLSRAFDEEVESWTTVGNELDLIDTTPAAGGTGYIDLRQAPKPPENVDDEEKDRESLGEPAEDEALKQAQGELQRARQAGDQSSTSSWLGRVESERDAKKARLSSAFFKSKERSRRATRGKPQLPAQSSADPLRTAEQVPVPMDDDEDLEMPLQSDVDYSPSFDPERDDLHIPVPAGHLPPVREGPNLEDVEREAKRQRVQESGDTALYAFNEKVDARLAAESASYVRERAREHYLDKEAAFLSAGVDLKTFLFGVLRNDFSERYLALAAGEGNNPPNTKKKGRKEIQLNALPPELQEKFIGPGGADSKEWEAWRAKEACDVLDLTTSKRIRQEKPSLIIPTRWVRTNKNDGLIGKDFLAKSRLVAQGFKDRSLGQYRRDAPTASAIAESICLAVCAHKKFIPLAKDIKNAYFLLLREGRRERDLPRPSKGRIAWTGPRTIATRQQGDLRLCGGGPTFLAGAQRAPRE